VEEEMVGTRATLPSPTSAPLADQASSKFDAHQSKD
jgi:hypothetical protein